MTIREALACLQDRCDGSEIAERALAIVREALSAACRCDDADDTTDPPSTIRCPVHDRKEQLSE